MKEANMYVVSVWLHRRSHGWSLASSSVILLAGLFSRHRPRNDRRTASTPPSGNARSSCLICWKRSRIFALASRPLPTKGGLPKRRQYTVAPRDQTSASRPSCASPETTSGLIKAVTHRRKFAKTLNEESHEYLKFHLDQFTYLACLRYSRGSCTARRFRSRQGEPSRRP